jgi:pyridoxal phosphate enzyme (YggS family)
MSEIADVAANVADVRRRIAAAGGEGRVRLIAVTKGFGAEAVDAAVRAGVADAGESYAQELHAKAGLVSEPEVRWHFIGRLQTNKVRSVAGVVGLWHTVDRLPLGEEIATRAPGARVLVQVNVSAESQKGGCNPRDVPGLVGRLRRMTLDVAGLMTIGATGPPESARPGFRLLNDLADDLGLAERSMGMSGDLDVAIEEGSTMVRIGRALFGERPRPGALDPSH